MRKHLIAVLSVLIVICGCANHYIKSKESGLYIYLKKPEAKSVYFLCSIDGYKFHRATKVGKRTWEVKVPIKREFKYFYIVDGEPFIPECQYQEADDFGSRNCIFVPYL